MTSKAYAVRGYVRSAPRDPYAEVRAAKTEQLRREVEVMRQSDGLGELLAEALDASLEDWFAFDFMRAR
jgi:hypothetical protein